MVFYSIPNSSQEFAPNLYLDDIYDGRLNKETNRLEGGLGILTDGVYGGRVILSDEGLIPGMHLLLKYLYVCICLKIKKIINFFLFF